MSLADGMAWEKEYPMSDGSESPPTDERVVRCVTDQGDEVVVIPAIGGVNLTPQAYEEKIREMLLEKRLLLDELKKAKHEAAVTKCYYEEAESASKSAKESADSRSKEIERKDFEIKKLHTERVNLSNDLEEALRQARLHLANESLSRDRERQLRAEIAEREESLRAIRIQHENQSKTILGLQAALSQRSPETWAKERKQLLLRIQSLDHAIEQGRIKIERLELLNKNLVRHENDLTELRRKLADEALAAKNKPWGEAPEPEENCLEEADRLTGGDRQDAYGPPADTYRVLGLAWEWYLTSRMGVLVNVSAEDCCFMLTLMKIAREITGPRGKRDDLVDGSGYLRLVEMIRARNGVKGYKP